jgi:hypothetical protein
MNLRKTILAEHSKANCNRIVKWVGTSQERFDELFELFTTDEYRVSQRAAWPLNYCAVNHPELLSGHFGKLIKNLSKKNIHDAVKRNTVRLLQYVKIPVKFEGPVMDVCFKYISSPTEPVAVKCFSLSVLGKLSEKYPEIKNEMREIIDKEWPMTAGLKARIKKLPFLKSPPN